MILVDTNIPIYAAGTPHPFREPCRRVLRLVPSHPTSFITNTEVLQEILHRYRTVGTWPQRRALFDEFAALFQGRTEAVHGQDVEAAARLADQHPHFQTRDLLHLAVMLRVGAQQIVSADRGFDTIPDIERLDPADVDAWASTVGP